jgi:hypothetical protein
MTGRKESCCARLKRWISSTKRSVPCPLSPRAGRLEDLLEVADAGENRRDLLEMQIGRLRQQAGNRGLAGAGRPPKHERTQRSRIEQALERAVRPEQMILADDLVEPGRPQLVSKRTRRRALEPRRGE